VAQIDSLKSGKERERKGRGLEHQGAGDGCGDGRVLYLMVDAN